VTVPSPRRTRLQTLAAALLALSSGLGILYAGFVPIPPFSDVPVPLALQVFGLAGLAAAVGVFVGQTWGRALGVGVVGLDLTLLAFRVTADVPTQSPLNAFVAIAFSGLPDLIVLWVLLRRWPGRA